MYLPFWPTVDVAAARVNPLLIGFTSGDQVDWPDFDNREVGATGGLINSFRATLIGLRPAVVTTGNRESGSASTDTSAASSASLAPRERIGRVPSRGTASIQPQSVLRSSSSTTERPALLNTATSSAAGITSRSISAEFAGGSVGTSASSVQRATSVAPNPGPTLPLNSVSTTGGVQVINSPGGTMPFGALPAQAPQGCVNQPGAYAMAVTPVVQPTTALYKGEIPFLNQFSKLRLFLEKGAEVERMGVKIDLKTRISEHVIRTIQYRIQAAKGYDKVGEDWLSWPWQAFCDFFTTGKGSVGKKDPGQKIGLRPFRSCHLTQTICSLRMKLSRQYRVLRLIITNCSLRRMNKRTSYSML